MARAENFDGEATRPDTVICPCCSWGVARVGAGVLQGQVPLQEILAAHMAERHADRACAQCGKCPDSSAGA